MQVFHQITAHPAATPSLGILFSMKLPLKKNHGIGSETTIKYNWSFSSVSDECVEQQLR
ncbi:hypothetical protein CAEBREN_19292 [Caenorhabditis brenneri]|uniref:Uncharacterized protein n=1 Tax=Caenorhabditis brenneri TaxID=135651 RepID=G0PAI9_CAEBE|nr:hypothetical protein CAEBREN_19292 [Caenorhabditis brenneri]